MWSGWGGGGLSSSNLGSGILMAVLRGTWRCRISAGTDPPDAGHLLLGDMASLVWDLCFSAAVHKIVETDNNDNDCIS